MGYLLLPIFSGVCCYFLKPSTVFNCVRYPFLYSRLLVVTTSVSYIFFSLIVRLRPGPYNRTAAFLCTCISSVISSFFFLLILKSYYSASKSQQGGSTFISSFWLLEQYLHLLISVLYLQFSYYKPDFIYYYTIINTLVDAYLCLNMPFQPFLVLLNNFENTFSHVSVTTGSFLYLRRISVILKLMNIGCNLLVPFCYLFTQGVKDSKLAFVGHFMISASYVFCLARFFYDRRTPLAPFVRFVNFGIKTLFGF